MEDQENSQAIITSNKAIEQKVEASKKNSKEKAVAPPTQQLSCSNSQNRLKYAGQKKDKSHEYFKGTKINSCSYVKMQGTTALAVPYYNKPGQSYAESMMKSTYTSSYSQ